MHLGGRYKSRKPIRVAQSPLDSSHPLIETTFSSIKKGAIAYKIRPQNHFPYRKSPTRLGEEPKKRTQFPNWMIRADLRFGKTAKLNKATKKEQDRIGTGAKKQ